MQYTETNLPGKTTAGFLSGGGDMGKKIRSYNWQATPLGAVENWPQSLRSAVSICLNSNFPIAIYWGPSLTLLYNDAWSPIPGNKHPWALGKPAIEVWPEIWNAIEPQFQKAFQGEPGGSKDALLPMHRHGYTEECYFDFTFTPIYGEAGKVEGVFNAVIETTKTILNERQLKTLRDLGNVDSTATNVDEVLEYAARAIEKNNKDFPFGIIYKIDKDQYKAVPVAYVGTEEDQTVFPSVINLGAPEEGSANFFRAYSTNQLVVSENNGRRLNLPKGGWDKEATQFLHLPIASQNRTTPVAIFSTALNPYRKFDDTYQQYVQLVADQISTEVNNMLAYEEEKKRAEALAQIDKAKTTFFTNISHEFRTPLTLILGTVEELLHEQDTASATNARLTVTHRNALRLLKLVNTLLDFSRLEAGRTTAVFQPTDLSTFTANIAANFRSAVEKAGLAFTVRCESYSSPVYVDHEMWEKIVLNLLSNAFKYTLKGSISVSLSFDDHNAAFSVTDTGIGIPENELPHMFERFHRVQNAVARTIEGSGIGLSLVNELVRLHGGSITVESKEGVGTAFTVLIPLGKAHLPADKVVEKTTVEDDVIADAFLEEASSLLPDADTEIVDSPGNQPAVLVVDDNTDMRNYIKSLLQKQYRVVTATNGAEALQKINEVNPDLIVSDVMMPVVDGIELLKAVKTSPKTATLPVILVSARAGDEARIEGLNIGADDYLVKPFSGKELLARVRSQININHKREAALQSVYHLFDEVPFAVAVLRGEDLVVEFINQYNLDIWQMQKADVLGKPLFMVRPDIKADAEPIHREVYRTGKRFRGNEIPVSVTNNGAMQVRYFNTIIDPLYDEKGNITGQLATTIEVTEQVLLRNKIEDSEQELQGFLMQAPAAIAVLEGEHHRFVLANDWYQKMFGRSAEQLLNKTVLEAFPESDGQGFHHWLDEIYRSGQPRTITELTATLNVNGRQATHFYDTSFQPLRTANGEVTRIMAMVIDVTEKVHARHKIEESETRLRSLANAMPQVVWIAESNGEVTYYNDRVLEFDGAKKLPDGNWAWEGMVHPDDIAATSEAWQQAVSQRTLYEQEHRIRMKDGQCRWHLSRALPQKDETGAVLKWYGTATDIHDQKQAAEFIKESESRFRTLAETIPQLVWMTDEKGEQEYASSRWQEYTGVKPANRQTWSQIVHPQDLPVITEAWTKSTVTGQFYRAEVRLKNKTGDYRWHAVQGEPLKDDAGNIIKWIGAFTDIHDQKAISTQLEKLVTERTKELERSNEDLQQFAHVASHDLKEPVRKVMTFANRLKEELGMTISERANLYLSKIESSAIRMYSMIDGVLLYSSLNALEQTKELVDLNEMMQNIESDLEVSIAEKKAVIVYEQLPSLEGSVILLYQLFYNLVNNALKFSSPQRTPLITLTAVTASKPEIEDLGLNAEKEYCKVSLQDNGIGFRPQDAVKIFGTFTRLHAKDKYEGTGLGLSLCKKIAERHGGTIFADGKDGEGAIFTVLLPLG